VVVVRKAAPGEYQVVDSKGADVTNQLSRGLPLGNYMVVASRLGFETTRQPFTIDASKGTVAPVDVIWKRLPVALTIKMTKAEGTLKVDDTEQPLDGGLEYKATWQSGSHTIVWQGPQGESLEVPFVVNDDGVEMKSPIPQGRFAGIVATFNKGRVTYQTANTGGLVKIVEGQSQLLGAAGEFSIDDGKAVTLQAKSGRSSLGDFPTGQPGQPLIYVYLAPQHLAPTHKAIDKPIEVASEPPQTPPPPPPPKEDGNKKKTEDYLKSLGVEVTPK
jgi:hypothetical protein